MFKYEGVVRILVLSKIDLCSAISFQRSQLELSIGMAEHKSTIENYPNGVTTLVLILHSNQV